jgi:YfiH family protein
MHHDDASLCIVPQWTVSPRIRAAVTTRRSPGESKPPFDRANLGARCDDDPDAVAANRAALASMLRLPSSPRWLRQVHGDAVHEAVAGSVESVEPVADAVHTRDAGVVCAVLTADCLPLLVAADEGDEIAAIHAGWRGLSGGVVEAAIARFATSPDRLQVWLGPAIGAASYEVGDEVRAAFVDADAGAAGAFAPTPRGRWWCDLYALARRRLYALGVRRVGGGGFDTYADPRFYSYRREPRTGRFASLIWITP